MRSQGLKVATGCVVIAVFVTLVARVAVASEVGGQGDTLNASDGSVTIIGTGGGTSSGGGGGLPPGKEAVQVPVLVGANAYCLTTVIVDTGTIFPPFNGVSTMTQVPCPGTVVPPPLPPSAADVVLAWSQTAILPDPVLVVPPGYAVTGLPAYLEIQTPTPWTVNIPDPIWTDTIAVGCVHVAFDVDWGDDSPPLHTTSLGGPFPDGDVSHAYQTAGTGRTLSVTEQWRCQWSDPLGHQGVIDDLHSTGRLPLEVREIQSLSG